MPEKGLYATSRLPMQLGAGLFVYIARVHFVPCRLGDLAHKRSELVYLAHSYIF